MGPTQPAGEAEWRVIRWLFGVMLIATLIYLPWSWWQRVRECRAICAATGHSSGRLRFNAGGRLNLGTWCECVEEE
jgi:hypothetical protein